MISLRKKLPELLSEEHMGALESALAAPARKERQVERSQKLFARGLTAYESGDSATAQAAWVELVQRDPASADGYYGLLLVAATDPLETKLQLWQALALTAERFGSEYPRPSVGGQLHWRPLGGLSSPVLSAADAVAAYVGILRTVGSRQEEMEQWIRQVPSGWQRSATEALAAYERSDFHAAAGKLQELVASDRDSAPEATLLLAECYRKLGMPTASEEAYRKLIGSDLGALLPSVGKELKLDARYGLAQLLQELGRDDESRAELERIYAEEAGFRNVAELLGAMSSADNEAKLLFQQLGDIGADAEWPDEQN